MRTNALPPPNNIYLIEQNCLGLELIRDGFAAEKRGGCFSKLNRHKMCNKLKNM